jgi:hypothetical protein
MFHGLDDYYEWIRTLPILERAGQHQQDDVRCVRSWTSADAICDENESVNHLVAIRNRLSTAIMKADRSAFSRRWNVNADAIWTHAESLRDEILFSRHHQLRHCERLTTRLLGHTVIAAQELLFSDLVQRDEALQLVEYFQTGHMVVGYRGEFPDGYRISF